MKSLPVILAAILLPFHAVLSGVAAPPVILTAEGVGNLGLETETAGESDFEVTTFALGRTESIPEKRSVLSSRIPGRVVRNRLRVGAYVTKGENLVLLESRQPGDPPPSVWLTAPADGTVMAVNTSLGAPVEPSDRIAEFAELRTIYLIATVPQSVAGEIRQGTRARVRFPVRPDRQYDATLLRFAACPCPDPACALGQDVSKHAEKTETADLNTAGVIFTIDNPDNQLRPEMSAECLIVMEKREGVMSVPREALHGGPANRHVYVKHMTIPHAFDRVAVRTGLSGNGRVEIVEGLYPGDEVATRGSYSLGFAGGGGGVSLKEALDAAHGHEHNEDGSEMTAAQKAAADAAKSGGMDDRQGLRPREVFLMAATAILALLLVLVSLRRGRPGNETTELS